MFFKVVVNLMVHKQQFAFWQAFDSPFKPVEVKYLVADNFVQTYDFVNKDEVVDFLLSFLVHFVCRSFHAFEVGRPFLSGYQFIALLHARQFRPRRQFAAAVPRCAGLRREIA